MFEHNLPTLTALALFTPADFFEINQLADLLFDQTTSVIELHSEHERVTQAWIASALHNSDLAKRCMTKPTLWTYQGNGKLAQTNSQPKEKCRVLTLPPLSLKQRVKLLQHYCEEVLQTHLLTVPCYTIKKALEWQGRYCADKDLLIHTMTLLQHAVNRFLLVQTDEQQAATLEPRHVAEILLDWQHVNVADLLRHSEDSVELKIFLTENVIGQSYAIEQFLQKKTGHNLFLLAGPPCSGKKTFAENYAQFTHGAKKFCITFNLSFFEPDIAWSDIFLASPLQNQRYVRFTEILENYPQAIILLTQAHENLELLERLQREIRRSFFQKNESCISVSGMTWLILFDMAIPESASASVSTAIEESIISENSSIELADILYRPSISATSPWQDENSFSADYPTELVKKHFSTALLKHTSLLIFLPLAEKSRKIIVNKEIKRIIQVLREKHQLAIYYQEEIVHALLNRVDKENQGFDELHKSLYHQIENIILKVLEQGAVTDEQILMLQLNDTGQALQIVRTNTRANALHTRVKI